MMMASLNGHRNYNAYDDSDGECGELRAAALLLMLLLLLAVLLLLLLLLLYIRLR